MSGVIAGVGVQPRWMGMASPPSTSSNTTNANGRFRVKMAATSVDEKQKAYTLQKSEEAFNKAKVYFLVCKFLVVFMFLCLVWGANSFLLSFSSF